MCLRTLLRTAAFAATAWSCIVPHPRNSEHQLEGADLRYKLVRHFAGEGPPPLEEVFLATQNLTRETQERLHAECPGLLICAFLIVAEARLPIAAQEASGAFTKADSLAARLAPEEFEAMTEVWPVREAFASYETASGAVEAARASSALTGRPRTVHLVVCHCREPLDWLIDGHLWVPAPTQAILQLFVYEKCGEHLDPGTNFTMFNRVSVAQVVDGDIRKDECSGYLRHIVDHYGDPADFTLFFQADAGDHLEWGYLALVMQAIEYGTLVAPFVHLNHPRLVASLSPCRERVFHLLFDRAPRQMLGSYCCAQFAVSRERVLSNPLEFYERMVRMLNGPSPDECHDIPGHSTHCLMFEVYWHVVFGEEDALPDRSENSALPLFLRIRDIENESYLPPDSYYLQVGLNV